jgi:hypothetical protein
MPAAYNKSDTSNKCKFGKSMFAPAEYLQCPQRHCCGKWGYAGVCERSPVAAPPHANETILNG